MQRVSANELKYRRGSAEFFRPNPLRILKGIILLRMTQTGLLNSEAKTCKMRPDGFAICYVLSDIKKVASAFHSRSGTCISQPGGRHKCKCPADLYGPTCTSSDPCSGEPCQHQGTCISTHQHAPGTKYRCICPTGKYIPLHHTALGHLAV